MNESKGRNNALLPYFFIVAFMFLSIGTSAQLTPDERRVTINFIDIPLDSALLLLSAKSGVAIAFDPAIIPEDRHVSLAANQLMLGLALDNVFTQTQLHYKIVGNQLIIKKKPPPVSNKQVTVSGYLKDGKTGEGLVYATVSTNDGTYGNSTNEYGYFSLSVPPGNYELKYSYVGYKERLFPVNLARDTFVTVSLEASTFLNEVLIVGEAPKEPKFTEDYDQMPIELLGGITALAGEPDIIRMAQMRSGVSSQVDGFGGLYVRGGNTDQNLVLLDGVPVYNTGHALGLFSIFNSTAIKSATLIKGGFPARYGGRLSSVMDVRIKEGNNQQFAGNIAISPLLSKATLEGPIVKGKSSFLVSARRTIVDPWLKPLSRYQFERNNEDGQINFFFYDVNAKVNFQIGQKNQLFLSGYIGKDRYANSVSGSFQTNVGKTVEEFDQSDINWGNRIATLRWTTNFNKRLFGHASLSYTSFEFDNFDFSRTIFDPGQADQSLGYTSRLFSSDIEDYIASYDLDWFVHSSYYLRVGVNYTRHRLIPGSDFSTTQDDLLNDENLITIRSIKESRPFELFEGNELRAYIENEFRWGRNFSANIGGHFSSITAGGTSYRRLQPRLSAQWKDGEKFTLKAGYSEMDQYFHLLSSGGLGLPSDVWLPSTEQLRPERSRQLSLSATTKIVRDISLTIGAFDKQYDFITGPAEGNALDIRGSLDWQENVPVGEGSSRGLEVEIEKRSGRIKGWIAYTLSKSENRFDLLYNGQTFRTQNDRRHLINLMSLIRLNENMEFSLGWTYGSPLVTTVPTSTRPVEIDGKIIFVPINPSTPGNLPLPVYHKLDVGFNIYNKYSWGNQKLSIGAYNVYARKNPFYVDLVLDPDGTRYVFERISILPLIPYVSLGLSF